MAKEKGSLPVRRLPSRSGRASFEADPTARATSSSSRSSARENRGPPERSSRAIQAVHEPTARAANDGEQSGAHSNGIAHLDAASGATTVGLQASEMTSATAGSGSSSSGSSSARSTSNTAPSGSVPAALPMTVPSPAPRGRGRPRRKALQVKVDDPSTSAPSTAGGNAQSPAAAALAPSPGAGAGAGAGTVGTDKMLAGAAGEVAAAHEGRGEPSGYDSDGWSEDDEVHHLSKDVKAQFGDIVWAKSRGNPPWPALVWDPRFLGKDKPSRDVARLAYSCLGKSHLVKFYDTKGSFSAVPYKSISPFDPAKLPSHLKACNTPKKKESLKEDVVEATENARLSKAERLAAMHEVGRWGASKKTKTKRTPDKPAAPAAASSTGGVTTEPGTSGDQPKKRGRGPPRKYPIEVVKALDADRPSPSSSGAEYELEMAKDPEETAREAGDGEHGAGIEAEDIERERDDEEEEAEEEEEDMEDFRGDDDDEEEYTMEAEPDDEDDKIFEESFASTKTSRKRGRSRKKPSRGKANGGNDEVAAANAEGGAQKRPRPSSIPPRGADEGEGTGAGVAAGGGGGRGGNGCSKKARVRIPGEAKARALAAVRAFCAGLPATEYGRDEGFIAAKDERREARAAGTHAGTPRAAGSGKRDRGIDDKGEGQSREKKAKKSKPPREERHKDEGDGRDRSSSQSRRDTDKVKSGSVSHSKSSETSKAGTASIEPDNGKLGAQVKIARDLVQRLSRASADSPFEKEEVLKVLRELGELEPSFELLQQSGCGKAVSNVRKYFFGGQVKHGDKDVASAASTLRTRWMEALGKGTPGSSSSAAASSADAKQSPQGSTYLHKAKTEPAPASKRQATFDGGTHSHAVKRENSALASSGAGQVAGWGRGNKAREKGGRGAAGSGGSGPDGGRYGVSNDDEKVVAAVAPDSEVKKGAATVSGRSSGRSIDPVVASPVKKETAPPAKELEEPRRRAMGMLAAVLGSAAHVSERCAAIEEELYMSQGREISKDYLRRLRNAVFSMEGPDAQRLRDKVMSEMVVPKDFVSKSSDELRALASMI